jgi:hypothetical protein
MKNWKKVGIKKTFEELLKIMPEDLLREILNLKNIEQRPDYHPEGDVYTHVKIVYDRALTEGDINMMITAIFHDIGKAYTSRYNPVKKYWSSPGHEMSSVRFVERFKDWIKEQGADYDIVHFVTKNHMIMRILHQMRRQKREAFMAEKYYADVIKFSGYDEMLNPKYGTFKK